MVYRSAAGLLVRTRPTALFDAGAAGLGCSDLSCAPRSRASQRAALADTFTLRASQSARTAFEFAPGPMAASNPPQQRGI
jgi:hypothetical protein